MHLDWLLVLKTFPNALICFAARNISRAIAGVVCQEYDCVLYK
jgi:hypothetical protein